jgi:predicted nucleic acid-binding protein
LKEIIIADSTCLIGLERISRLNILKELYETVIIPPQVEKES